MWVDVNKVRDDDWRPSKSDIIGLYSKARENGWSRGGVHELMKAQFKKASSKELTYSEYEKVLEWLDTIPSDTTTVERDENTIDMFDQRPKESM